MTVGFVEDMCRSVCEPTELLNLHPTNFDPDWPIHASGPNCSIFLPPLGSQNNWNLQLATHLVIKCPSSLSELVRLEPSAAAVAAGQELAANEF
ncbi:hypothetical protein H634G_00343 [Metarhizium anisopliae BRIP 53293]|uniref:Uncharacterized protein n=1 Tax=Metarhizium anisopliae BRIP 53293 TaxID=1291518 RepID=A0A0D9PGM5_METAN|nr:hypothetical protein H634G_00343 [Metarhizium anisopliae BRIP 53293]KJK91650.1 hypothetical protein H633G_04484 [Metarhizium anisopliae BRIP 53284]